MMEAIDSQEISRVRHDLRTVVNHFQGYVLLLREEEEAWLRQLDVADALDSIEEAGRDILQVVDRTHARKRDQSPSQALAHLQASMQAPALAAETAVITLMRIPEGASHRDVQRLRVASERLRLFINSGGFSDKSQPTSHLGAAAGAARSHVLVVEDDDANRELLERMLSRFGYSVSGAINGMEALSMIGARRCDVVLLDMLLPDTPGLDLLKKVRALDASIPVIVISALSEVEHIVECIEAGAEDYFTKPFIPALLRTRVASALDRKKYRDLLAQAASAVERN